jgi:hypothetical protein
MGSIEPWISHYVHFPIIDLNIFIKKIVLLLLFSVRATMKVNKYSMNSNGYTVKKIIDIPVPSRDVTNKTLHGRELSNYSPLGRVWLVTSQMGTGKSLTFFTVY